MSSKRCLPWLFIFALLIIPAPGRAVVGGQADNPASWPGLVMVRANTKPSAYGVVASCTATLVAVHWVLTAAHCFDGQKYAFVSHGMSKSSGGDWLRVSEIHRYSGWNKNRLSGDLALLKLPEEWTGAQPILWAKSFRDESLVRILGWGATGSDRRGNPVGAGTFRSAWTTIHSPARCRRGIDPSQGANTLCAGDQQHNICQGDSGGPLLIKSSGLWKQIGIASFGNARKCGASPAYYTDLYAYKKWVTALLAR